MRRLIVNADDFGLTSGVNRAIVRAHEHGVVTSATLMATGVAFEEAVALAKSTPRLAIGCHVVLANGMPLLPASRVGTLLVPDHNGGQRFHHSLAQFAMRALRGQFNAEEIEAEAIAQIRHVQNADITVTHVDTHKHTHMFPAVLRPLWRAAKACGVPAIRNPFAPDRPLPMNVLMSRPNLWPRYAEVELLRTLRHSFRREIDKSGLATTDGTAGIVITGAMDQVLFGAALENLPQGTWEFVCHPGYHDADLATAGTRLLDSREQELTVLTSGETKQLMARSAIELVSYRDLKATVG